uniref:Trafficking protein particle complex subunit 12 n=1 Tax=Panagrellus redivivus TaxID=6233 RepID=A0A7E4UQP1_PANRE
MPRFSRMSQQPPWAEVAHLYIWPESTSLQNAIDNGKFETVYTMPGIKSDDMLVDKMAVAVSQITGKHVQRPNVATNVDGLKQLIAQGHLRMAYNLTTTLLTGYGQGLGRAGHPSRNSFETFEIWSCRFQLMMALKLHQGLVAELSAFENLDAPDTYFQYYPELAQQGYTGSMLPFQMRLIHAEAPRFTPNPVASVTLCCALAEKVRQIINQLKADAAPEAHVRLWEQRLETVLLTKARAWFTMKEYHQCIAVYTELLPLVSDERKVKILQHLQRVAVVIGDAKLVEHYSREITIQNSGSANFYLHKGIKAAFYGNYGKAVENLQAAQKGSGGLTNPVVANNEAICQLYHDKVEEAQSHLLSFPVTATEPILINISTIATLAASSKDDSKRKFFAKSCDKMSDLFDPQASKVLC